MLVIFCVQLNRFKYKQFYKTHRWNPNYNSELEWA